MYVTLYRKSNNVITDFSICYSESLDKIHSTFCRIWKLPSTTHNNIIHKISSNLHIIIEKRLIKFIHSPINGNVVYRQFLFEKLRCKKSFITENYRHLSWKYNFSVCDWNANIT